MGSSTVRHRLAAGATVSALCGLTGWLAVQAVTVASPAAAGTPIAAATAPSRPAPGYADRVVAVPRPVTRVSPISARERDGVVTFSWSPIPAWSGVRADCSIFGSLWLAEVDPSRSGRVTLPARPGRYRVIYSCADGVRRESWATLEVVVGSPAPGRPGPGNPR